MPEQAVNLLLACSAETAGRVRRALTADHAKHAIRHVWSRRGFDAALAEAPCHLVLSELEIGDLSALELLDALVERDPDLPILLFKDSGPSEIAIRCLERGVGHFIVLGDQYLNSLPILIDAFLKRAAEARFRRLIEKKLIESEERYLDVFDNTSDLIQCLAPDGHFHYVNRAWRETLGYAEQEVKTLHLMDVLHPDSMQCCQDRFKRLLAGESLCSIQFKFRTKSGDTVHLKGDCGSIMKDGVAVSTRGIFSNVTAMLETEAALRASEARYQALYENAPDIYVTLGMTGQILSINLTGAHLLGYQVDELIGESASKVIHPEDQPMVFSHLTAHFHHPVANEGIEYRAIRKDGSIMWVHQRARLEPDTPEDPRLLVICRDVTERRRLEDKLAYQATHDALTNLVNRQEFERRLNRVLAGCQGAEESHVLCFLDLDKFKSINDTCGHIAGDELLRQVAALLQGQVRSRDTLARLGGDEFGVLMEHCALEQAVQMAEKIRASVEAFQFYWRAERFSIGVSIGIMPLVCGQTLSDALNLADSACYSAKREGRNRIQVHDA